MEPVFNVTRFGQAYLLKETELVTWYVDWYNNFITLSAFAEHYSLCYESALFVVMKGEEINNNSKHLQ